MSNRIQRIKNEVPITALLAHYEVPYHKYSEHRIKIRCFLPGHEDRNPSGLVFLSDNVYKCFSCVFHGDVIDVVMLKEELTRAEAITWLEQTFQLDNTPFPESEEQAREDARNARLVDSNLDLEVYQVIHQIRKQLGPFNTELSAHWGIISDEREAVDEGCMTLVQWNRRSLKRIRENIRPLLVKRRVRNEHVS